MCQLGRFTEKDLENIEVLYGSKEEQIECIKEAPELWTKCEVCGKPTRHDTGWWCDNVCLSQVNKGYKDDCGFDYNVTFCWDCYEKRKKCPICGERTYVR